MPIGIIGKLLAEIDGIPILQVLQKFSHIAYHIHPILSDSKGEKGGYAIILLRIRPEFIDRLQGNRSPFGRR